MTPSRGRISLSLLLGLWVGPGCATRSYTHYLIEPAPAVNPALEEPEGTQVRPLGYGSTTAMTVQWNDGDVLTEVQIPMLGLRVNPDAAAVSLTEGRTRMNAALADGNYAVALQWAELVLARYPSHPETLRAKGSILLLLGERDKAIEVYEAAEEIETDPKVRAQLEALQAR